MIIKLLRYHYVLYGVLLPVTFYSSIVIVKPMHCTRLACITNSYSIRDLIFFDITSMHQMEKKSCFILW